MVNFKLLLDEKYNEKQVIWILFNSSHNLENVSI